MPDVQRIFLNSIPKSGTNLLKRLLDLLGYRDQNARPFRCRLWQRFIDGIGMGTPWSLHHGNLHRHLRARDPSGQYRPVPAGLRSVTSIPYPLLKRWLDAVPDGHYMTGHVPWSIPFCNLLSDLDYRQIVVLRDPGEVLNSRLQYERNWCSIRYDSRFRRVMMKLVRWGVEYMPGLDVSLARELMNRPIRKQLSFLLEGGRSEQGNRVLGLREQYERMVSWRQSDRTLIVRYGDMIGPEGNGSREAQIQAVKRVGRFLGLSPENMKLNRIARKLYHRSSKTYRPKNEGEENGVELMKHVGRDIRTALEKIDRFLANHEM